MPEQDNNRNIRENVIKFYANHKEACDRCYDIAEAESINELYYDITDPFIQAEKLSRTSTIILTANKYEKNILHKRICSAGIKQIGRIEITLSTVCERYNKVFAYCFEWNDYSILHFHANVTGSYTIGGVSDIIRWIISNDYLMPTAIVSFGVCFGTNESDYEIGNVIISKKVYPYFIGAKIDGENLSVVDDNAFAVNSDLLNKIQNLRNNNRFNSLPFQVKFENYITGEAVISSLHARDTFVHTTTQKILAGDMEGYGLFKECGTYGIPCIIIKAICDWGAEKNINALDEDNRSCLKCAFEKYSEKYTEEEISGLLKTIKDRMQAFSANCAFDALNIMLDNRVFNTSLRTVLRAWILSYRGIATTCKRAREKLEEISRNLGLRYAIPNSFVHTIMMTLEAEGLIEVDKGCKDNKQTNYSSAVCDSSIYLIRKEE